MRLLHKRTGYGLHARQLATAGPKNGLDRLFEYFCDREREREAGLVPFRFNRVDCLAGYAEPRCKLALGPPALCAQFGNDILHRDRMIV